MTVFISYARANLPSAEQLRVDVERCHRDVWLDRELTGGQSWWQAILKHIRECDVFVATLSPEWLESTACDLELRYAIALQRPILPVMVSKIDLRLTPREVVDAQIVDYRERSGDTAFALRDALDTLPSAPPLPEPLPPEPAPPVSYLHDIVVMLNAESLPPRSQYDLWERLQRALAESDGEEQAGLLMLARKLRKRHDVLPTLRAPIDAILGETPPPSPGPEESQETQPRITPSPPPPPRKRRGVVWVLSATFVVLAGFAIWIGVAIAKNSNGDGTPPTTTTTATTTTTTTAPITTTTTRRTTTTQSTKITMPDLSGMTVDQAKDALRVHGWKGNLRVTTKTVESGDLAGLILDQAPKGGIVINNSAQVNVTVGQFKSPSSLPPTG